MQDALVCVGFILDEGGSFFGLIGDILCLNVSYKVSFCNGATSLFFGLFNLLRFQSKGESTNNLLHCELDS